MFAKKKNNIHTHKRKAVKQFPTLAKIPRTLGPQMKMTLFQFNPLTKRNEGHVITLIKISRLDKEKIFFKHFVEAKSNKTRSGLKSTTRETNGLEGIGKI